MSDESSRETWQIYVTDAAKFISMTEEFLGVPLKLIRKAMGEEKHFLQPNNRPNVLVKCIAKRTDKDGNTLDLIFMINGYPVWGARSSDMPNNNGVNPIHYARAYQYHSGQLD